MVWRLTEVTKRPEEHCHNIHLFPIMSDWMLIIAYAHGKKDWSYRFCTHLLKMTNHFDITTPGYVLHLPCLFRSNQPAIKMILGWTSVSMFLHICNPIGCNGYQLVILGFFVCMGIESIMSLSLPSMGAQIVRTRSGNEKRYCRVPAPPCVSN